MSLIPDALLRAIMARPARERTKLLGEWAATLIENERRAKRIREQIERGFIRYVGEGGEGL